MGSVWWMLAECDVSHPVVEFEKAEAQAFRV